MTLGLVLPLISSCIFDDEVIVEEKQDPVMFTFTLDVLSSADTRADGSTWGDNLDADPDNDYPEVVGSSLENKIITSSVEVFAYDMDGNFKAQLPILLCSENESGKVSFTCAVPEDIKYEDGIRYKYVILANCTDKNYGYTYQGNTPNLEGLIYETPFSEVKPIPMWGVVSYRFGDDYTGEQNKLIDLKTVNLLRAAAKVGVKLSDDLVAEGYSIKPGSLKLNYARPTGYCIPNNWNSRNVWNTTSLAHAGAFRPTASALVTNINASASSADGGYYFYVPETANRAADQLSLAVTLVNDGNEEYEFTYAEGIKFCTYNDGKPTDDLMDIVRNHFYDFTITEVNVGMKVSLDVADWYDAPEWNLDFSAPVHTKLLVSPRDAAPDPMEEPTVAYSNINDEDAAFVGYFKMESPEGVSWKPTLTNASAGDFEVRVYTNGQTNPGEYDIPVTEPEIMASENQFFKIVVVAKNPNLVDKVVKLGISYTSSWNDENSLLLINKDEYGLYYPWIDNDPTDSKDDPDEHWISIKQVSSK